MCRAGGGSAGRGVGGAAHEPHQEPGKGEGGEGSTGTVGGDWWKCQKNQKGSTTGGDLWTCVLTAIEGSP